MDVELPPEPCAVIPDSSTAMPLDAPGIVGQLRPYRASARSERSGMTVYLGPLTCSPRCTAAVNGPSPSPRFYYDMPYKGLRTLCKWRGYPSRGALPLLITRLFSVDQIERERALGDPGIEPSAAKERAMVAVLHSASVMDKEVIKRHGQRWGPAMEDSWGAPPTSPADGVGAAISAWTADLRDKISGEDLSREGEWEYATCTEPAAWEGCSGARACGLGRIRCLSPGRCGNFPTDPRRYALGFDLGSNWRKHLEDVSPSEQGLPGSASSSGISGDCGAH